MSYLLLLLVGATTEFGLFSFLFFQIFFALQLATGQHEPDSRNATAPALRSILMSRIAKKFHAGIHGASVRITGTFSNPDCMIRIGRFEFRCKTLLATLDKSKSRLAAKSGSGAEGHVNTSLIVIVSLATVMFISTAFSAFYCFFIKKKRSKCESEYECESVCEPTTSSV